MFEAVVVDTETAVAVVVPGDVAATFSDAELMAGITQLERVRSLLDAVEGVLLAELDSRGICDRDWGLRTAGWVATTCGTQRSNATARIQVGRTLRTLLRDTETALAAGSISWAHARVLTDAANPRIAAAFAGPVERELLALAPLATFRRWSEQVRRVAELLDDDGGHRPNDDETNRFTLSPMLDGVIELRGQLAGVAAETLRQAIERVTGELVERMRRDHATTDGELTIPTPPQLRALALVELARRATVAGDPGSVGPRPEISLMINADDLHSATGTVTEASTPTGVRLAGGHLASLLCDCSIFPIIRDSLGVPLDMGRQIRTPNRAQRRALAARDGGCVFPGCDAHPDRCHSHHLDEWLRNLGHTNVARMVLLCPHHHAVIHRRGWHINLDQQHWATITTPNGNQLGGQRHRTLRAPARDPALC